MMESTNNFQLTTYNKQSITRATTLTQEEIAAIRYHDIFDYPLTLAELIKWKSARQLGSQAARQREIYFKNGFYFLGGREGIVYKRLLKKRISARKMEIAKRAARILSLIPTVKVVGVTGALAMENASDESDIDLMIITSKRSLWTTRAIALITLIALRVPIRKFGNKNQKDKLCLNMWLDESNLIFRKRNIYTAHEIAQIVPLVNKDKTFERLIAKNLWTRSYWPSAARNQKLNSKKQIYKLKIKNFYSLLFDLCFSVVETIAFKAQYVYMRNKITKEKVTPIRALFHPLDWSSWVLKQI